MNFGCYLAIGRCVSLRERGGLPLGALTLNSVISISGRTFLLPSEAASYWRESWRCQRQPSRQNLLLQKKLYLEHVTSLIFRPKCLTCWIDDYFDSYISPEMLDSDAATSSTGLCALGINLDANQLSSFFQTQDLREHHWKGKDRCKCACFNCLQVTLRTCLLTGTSSFLPVCKGCELRRGIPIRFAGYWQFAAIPGDWLFIDVTPCFWGGRLTFSSREKRLDCAHQAVSSVPQAVLASLKERGQKRPPPAICRSPLPSPLHGSSSQIRFLAASLAGITLAMWDSPQVRRWHWTSAKTQACLRWRSLWWDSGSFWSHCHKVSIGHAPSL